jgi:hypothetical protein
MRLLAIDPGNTHSAYVVYDGTNVCYHAKDSNEQVLYDLKHGRLSMHLDHMAIEMIASYGMPVGREVFDTCVWVGRFVEAWDGCSGSHTLVYRRDVKLHLCGSPRAKDANVRQALLDKFGGKERAVGRKAAPGPLYGVKADVWAALGVAVTWWETMRQQSKEAA